jgi:hypothetical protein
MPTDREREYYQMGFQDGLKASESWGYEDVSKVPRMPNPTYGNPKPKRRTTIGPRRKLSAWNKFVKANSKKPRFRYASGRLKLKKMAVAFRKTPAGKKKRSK